MVVSGRITLAVLVSGYIDKRNISVDLTPVTEHGCVRSE